VLFLVRLSRPPTKSEVLLLAAGGCPPAAITAHDHAAYGKNMEEWLARCAPPSEP